MFVAIAALTLSSCTAPGPVNGVGLQLYSVRDAMRIDPAGTIEKVGAMGYDFVETAGYDDGKIYGYDPEEFKILVEENGMKFLGAHLSRQLPDSGSYEEQLAWWDIAIDAHKKAGAEYMVQPSMGGNAFASLEGLQRYCDYFNEVGAKCNAAGIKFGFHNHDKEFTTVLDGHVVYDYMLANTDPDKVFFQLDLYWIHEGGGNELDYYEKNPGRFLSYHIKDEKELGESGEMDFQPSFDVAEQAGAIWNVVEVERYNHDPLESVEISLDYLREIGFTR